MDSNTTVPEPLSTWTMTPEVRNQISSTIGCLSPETGGMLGGCRAQRLVTHFYFDGTAAMTGVTYSPDIEQCNRILTRDWSPRGVDLLGFIHSHPAGLVIPSAGDIVYAARILQSNPELRLLLLPIVASRTDGHEFVLRPYAARLDGDEVRVEPANMISAEPGAETDRSLFETLEMFSRVKAAYDLAALERSRILAIGCGGSASFVEDLARAGVGEFVLVDPDIVTETNLGTQQTYRGDLGRPKVSALADRIRDINPYAFVIALPLSLNEFTDVELCYVASIPLRHGPPRTTLVCGMTDDFYAQARVNQLALNFSLPSLCAQVYEEGRGAEISFTHSKTTDACHRCVLRSRYDAYEVGFKNDVGSTGTPFASTARLNALKQFVALALLHHGTLHPRWGGLLERIGNRNLIQLRLHPAIDLPAFRRTFRGADPDRVFCDEAVWLPQQPVPNCPDCAGDLRNANGRFRDTRAPLFKEMLAAAD